MSGSIDIEFSERGVLGKAPGVEEHHVYDSGIYLLTRDDDPLASRDEIREEDLGGRVLMVGGGSPPKLKDVQQRVLKQPDVDYFNSDDHDTTLVNVAAGVGICLSPGFLMGDERGIKWTRFVCPETFDCVLCTRANDDRESVRRLVEIIVEEYGSYEGPL
ncbi:MAG: hypothetical protein IJ856_02490 [Candidatus Methanomethylophilaceae archaeon]|nr:hypothetical protein [Candidatus Methanomethylophilaceae archaeon]